METSSKKPQTAILVLLVSLASVGAVLFTPGLPGIAKHFELSTAEAQLTLSLFLIGYTLGQLPWGPLANRFGRKPSLYFGLSLSIFGALGAFITGFFSSYGLFLSFVLIAAIGASVGLKTTFTLIGDVFTQKEATKRIAYCGLSFAIAPGLAVAFGGFIISWLNWQSCFAALAVYGGILSYLSSFLPETGGELDPHALLGKKVLDGFLVELGDRRLVLCALIWGLGTATVYLFANMAPFIGIDYIGLSPETYGLWNFIPLVGLVFGCLSARALVDEVSAIKVMITGFFLFAVGIVLQLALFLSGKVVPWSLFFPMIMIYFGFSLIFVNVSGMALVNAKNKSNASSVVNFIDMGIALLACLLLTFIPTKIPASLPLFYAALALIMGPALFILVRRFKSTSDD